jgi:hypothetical protein
MLPGSLFCSVLKGILSLPKTPVNASFVFQERAAKLDKKITEMFISLHVILQFISQTYNK